MVAPVEHEPDDRSGPLNVLHLAIVAAFGVLFVGGAIGLGWALRVLGPLF